MVVMILVPQWQVVVMVVRQVVIGGVQGQRQMAVVMVVLQVVRVVQGHW